jgi:hypothetical protein
MVSRLLAVLLLLQVGCKPARRVHGEHYVSEAERLDGQVLRVWLRYQTCNENAPFELRHQSSNGAAKIWLWRLGHPASGGCDMGVTEHRQFPLPPELHDAGPLTLLTPDGRQIVLRR